MAAHSHIFLTLALLASAMVGAPLNAADTVKDSPFTQSGGAKSPTKDETLDFAGVSTVGKKTMINLYDREAKRGFWVQEGDTSDGVTVVKYDGRHDQVTVRRKGIDTVLPLRSASAVVSGPANSPTTPAPIQPVTPAPIAGSSVATPAGAPAMDAGATATPTTTTPQTRARQEEEARMLVSDLLEIGIAQRKAYEDAQKKAAAQSQPTNGAPNSANGPSAGTTTNSTTDQQQSQPAPAPTPSGG
jgi:hypothetical protein